MCDSDASIWPMKANNPLARGLAVSVQSFLMPVPGSESPWNHMKRLTGRRPEEPVFTFCQQGFAVRQPVTRKQGDFSSREFYFWHYILWFWRRMGAESAKRKIDWRNKEKKLKGRTNTVQSLFAKCCFCVHLSTVQGTRQHRYICSSRVLLKGTSAKENCLLRCWSWSLLSVPIGTLIETLLPVQTRDSISSYVEINIIALTLGNSKLFSLSTTNSRFQFPTAPVSTYWWVGVELWFHLVHLIFRPLCVLFLKGCSMQLLLLQVL